MTDTTINHKRRIVITIKMMELGISGSSIAREYGLNRNDVNGEIRGMRRSKRVRQAIADRLGFGYTELWGDDVLFTRGRPRKAQPAPVNEEGTQ